MFTLCVSTVYSQAQACNTSTRLVDSMSVSDIHLHLLHICFDVLQRGITVVALTAVQEAF
jgi:hypothetical protein